MNRITLLLLLLLPGCEPEYTPPQTVLATREAAQYITSVAKTEMVWQLSMCFSFILVLIILFFIGSLAWFYAQDRNADTGLKKAHARKAMLAALGNGVVLDLETGELHHTLYSSAPQITSIGGVDTYPETSQEETIERFIIEAAAVSEQGWDSTVLPRWKHWQGKFKMTAAEWMRWTDELQRLKYVDKTHGRNTMVVYNHNLKWLYDQLTHPEEKE